MSAVSGFEQTAESARTGYFDAACPYEVDEHYWGYVIRPLEPVPVRVLVSQAVAWVAGIVLIVATLRLWVFTVAVGDLVMIRLALSIVLLGLSACLLWYASRGMRSEIQVDMRQREVREVVRNRTGQPTLLGRYPFGTIGGVFLDRSGARNQARASHASLVLRYRNTAQMLPVVHGRATDLIALRDRLGRDVIVNRPGHAADRF